MRARQTKRKATWKETISSLWHFLAEDKKRLVGSFVIAFFKSVASISLSIFIGYLVDGVFSDFADPQLVGRAWSNLLYSCLIIAAGYAVYFTLYLIASKIVIKLSFNLGFRIRDLIFMKIHKIPYGVMQRQMTGDLMAKATIDVNALAVNMSFSVSNIFVAPVIALCVYVGLFILSPYLGLIALGLFALNVFGSWCFARWSMPKFEANQHVLGELNVEVEEQIANRKVTKAFNLQQKAFDRFSAINRKQRDVATDAEIRVTYIFPWNELIECLMLTVLYAVGIVFYLNGVGGGVFGPISVATLTAFSMLVKYSNGEAANSLRIIGFVQKMLISGERCLSVLKFPDYVDESADRLACERGDIEFKNVWFSYKEGEPVLKDVSFFIPSRTTTTIVGPTGSGKTTIVNLLSRFYEADSGSIAIDGRDIKTVSQASLCDNVAVVLQDSFLFSETIRNNIAYGNMEASDEQIVAAAKAANIHAFIDGLPQKYDTVISERVNDFSDGQIQMIALARAFLSRAPILILDEATSSVDTKTEADIQDAMLRLMRQKTVIIIAHRLSTIVHADQILVMRSGRIVERGKHEELLAANGFYYRLYAANAVMD